jgi:hypothetical protein
VPPRDRATSVPQALSDAVLASLAKDPAQRPTAEAFAELLKAAMLAAERNLAAAQASPAGA